ncbi:MAG: hypothetical protein RH947_11890 [Alcanivorax sp.]
MNIRHLKKAIIASAALLTTSLSAPALADFTIHYKADGSGGWQGPAASEPVPTSYQDAVDNDFYYIFDSFYLAKDGGGWVGDRVELVADAGIITIPANCRLQLGGYIWQEGDDPKTVNIAVTHSRVGKPVPNGFEPNDDICNELNGDGTPVIDLFFNNNQPSGAPYAGAWTASATAADVNTGTFTDFFNNVQVEAMNFECASGPGDGGAIEVTYNENPVGQRVEFDFNAAINPSSFLSCSVDGTLYSVWEKEVLDEPDHTPGTPNPSSLSRGVVDHISNP